MSHKAKLFMLVDALHSRHLTNGEMGHLLGISAERVRQIVILLRLEPPKFHCFADLCTWLAKECPDLERECRFYRGELEITTESQAGNVKVA